jgi:spore coat protein U-like protein
VCGDARCVTNSQFLIFHLREGIHMQVKNFIAAAAVVALGAGAVGSAQAANPPATATFNVTMTITSACAITTAPTNINLGSFAATTTALTTASGSTTFKVNCSNRTPFTVGLAPSSVNSGDSNGNGNMAGAITGNTDKVPYTLHQTSATGPAWGNTVGTNTVAGTGAGMAAGNAKSFTAYAQATNADFAPDSYSDTVTVNVNY